MTNPYSLLAVLAAAAVTPPLHAAPAGPAWPSAARAAAHGASAAITPPRTASGRSGRGDTPESVLATLARAALAEPAAPAIWAALAAALEHLRPTELKNLPMAAERLALRFADSLSARAPGSVLAVRVESAGDGARVVIETGGQVQARWGDVFEDASNPRVFIDLDGAVNALPADEFRPERGGVRRLRIARHGPGSHRVVLHLAGRTAYSVSQRADAIVVSLDGLAPAFEPWDSRPAWSRPDPTEQARLAAIFGVDLHDHRAPARSEGRLAPHASTGAPVDAPATGGAALRDGARRAARRAGTMATAAFTHAAGLVGAVPRPSVRTASASGIFAFFILAPLGLWFLRRSLRRRLRPNAGPARVRQARNMIARGAAIAEIARRTGLARDVLGLLAAEARRGPDAFAASGRIFRVPAGPASGGRRRAHEHKSVA